MWVIVDHDDSYTHLLAYRLGCLLGVTPAVISFREVSVDRLKVLGCTALVLSPGPGSPHCLDDIGVSLSLFQAFPRLPILGVCLGHQALAVAFGGRVVPGRVPMHGKQSILEIRTTSWLSMLNGDLSVMRYHSLVVEAESLPSCFQIDAVAKDDGAIMAISHRECAFYGVQFHPESVGTACGDAVLQAFLAKVPGPLGRRSAR